MVIVNVEVQDAEIFGTFADSVQHQHGIRDGITHFRVEPQGRRRTTDKPRKRHGIAASEKGDVMAEADEFFREIGNDPLRAAIKPRRYALNKWRDLGNFHRAVNRTIWLQLYFWFLCPLIVSSYTIS